MNQMNDNYFMKLAIAEAAKAFEKNEVPIGAVVVFNNQLLSKGHNMVELLKDSTAHAEMIALTAAFEQLGSKYLPDVTVYVTVEPCIMCAGALYWSKVGRIVFGIRDEKNGFSKHFPPNKEGVFEKHPFHPKTIIQYGLESEACLALMQSFFQQLRNKR
jgi:tRNA(adenine34) deaminase